MQPDLGHRTNPSAPLHVERAGRLVVGEGVTRRREVRLALDVRAPAAARTVLAGALGDRVSVPALSDAALLVSELISNSVRHSGACADEQLVLRIQVKRSAVRIEVEDPGCGESIALRTPDDDGGFGLNIVREISERWGVERVAAGGTRVWAQIALAV